MLHETPFREGETHGIVMRAENQQRISSDRHGWMALYASAQHEVPYEGRFPAVRDQLLVLHRSGPATLERQDGRRRRLFTVPTGGVHLYPGGLPFNVRLMDELDTMHVYLRRSVIEEVAADVVVGDPAGVELPPRVLEGDPQLEHLLTSVYLALTDDDTTVALYVEYLARAIAAHLVRRYSDRVLRPTARPGIDAGVGRALEYMRAHLARQLSILDLAREAGGSPSHLSRQFRQQLGAPPYAYLIEMRLQVARDRLEKSAAPIAAIALDCGFCHQEHLTRFFRRRFRTTPAAWRRAHRH